MGAFRHGDIVLVSFDPSAGHEATKMRPVVVVSNDEYNNLCNLSVVAPITSTDNGYPLHVEVGPGNVVEGHVAVEQLKSLDLAARDAMLLGRLDPQTMAVVDRLVLLCFR